MLPTKGPLGVYAHVPFCASACDFCAFYQEGPDRAALEDYLAAMEAELALRPPGRAVETVFWGGGTPGLLPPGDLERLGRALLAQLPGPPAEWTVELAPSTVKADKLAVLRALGVNRLSLGVQSFQPRLLEAIGRRQSVKQARAALELCREAGFDNLNLDLMFALPGQSLADAEADLRAAAAEGPAHISTYCLTFEDDTALYAQLRRGALAPPDEEVEADCYRLAQDLLPELGYRQYEVSNYARPGRACRHNLNTWAMAEWLGYGPSAASQYGGRRWTNVPDLTAWQAGLRAGAPAEVAVAPLTDAVLAADALAFGLRMAAGVDLAGLAARWPQFPYGRLDRLWERLADAGLALRDGPRLRLTRDGLLVADAVAVEVLAQAEQD